MTEIAMKKEEKTDRQEVKKKVKSKNSLKLILLGVFGVFGCSFGGSYYPTRQAIAYLEEKGINKREIRHLQHGEHLSKTQFQFFFDTNNRHVLCLLAKHKLLPRKLLLKLMRHDNVYIRSYTAENISLTIDDIKNLAKDHEYVVYALVMNPIVPKDIIMNLYNSQYKGTSKGLACFASNPACPEEIKKEILKRNKYTEIRRLENTKILLKRKAKNEKKTIKKNHQKSADKS